MMDGSQGVEPGNTWRVGVDSGGTFTDVCMFDEASGRIAVWKVSSTPDDPSRGIAQGVEEGMTERAGGGSDPAAQGLSTNPGGRPKKFRSLTVIQP